MKYTKEFKVGLFAIIAIAGLYLGFYYLKGEDFFSDTRKYYVIYSNVGGLEISNPVKINGVIIGRVSRKKLIQGKIKEKKNEVVVELDLEGDIILGRGANATLESDFLGNISIDIEDGDLSDPINYGDTISGLLAKGIEDLLKESALPVANNLEVTIKKVNAILDNLTGNGDKINEMVDNYTKASYDIRVLINSSKKNLDSLTLHYKYVAQSLNQRLKDTKPLIRKYSELADSLKAVDVQTTLNKFSETLDHLSVTIDKLNNGTGTMSKLLNNDSLYVNLNKSLEDLDRMLIHMNEEPKHFFAPLGKSKKKIEKQRENEAKKEN